MDQKLPYYMVYPMPLAYDDERTERRDYEYMKSLYPEMARRILPYVEEECDRLDMPGGMIYDEYPDRLQLRLMCSRIYQAAMKQEQTLRKAEAQEWRDLIEVMLYQELYKRRSDVRRARRRFY